VIFSLNGIVCSSYGFFRPPISHSTRHRFGSGVCASHFHAFLMRAPHFQPIWDVSTRFTLYYRACLRRLFIGVVRLFHSIAPDSNANTPPWRTSIQFGILRDDTAFPVLAKKISLAEHPACEFEGSGFRGKGPFRGVVSRRSRRLRSPADPDVHRRKTSSLLIVLQSPRCAGNAPDLIRRLSAK